MKRFVVEVTPTVSDDGSTSTFLFSARAWRTKPTDTPANTRVLGLLKNPGTLKRELFNRARVTGAITPSFGNLVFDNRAPARGGAGPLDDWVDYGIAGSLVTVRWGDTDAAYPAGYATVFIAYAAGFLADSDELTIRLRDQLQLLDQPILTEGFAGTGGLEGGAGIAKKKQFVSGDPGFIEPILVDAQRQIYFVQSTANGGTHDLWKTNALPLNPFDTFDNAVELTRVSTNYSTAADVLAAAPSAGEVKFYFGPTQAYAAGWRDGGVYFRLGSPPAGDLRTFAAGYPKDEDHARIGATWGTFTASHLAARAGIAAANLDLTGFNLPVGPQAISDASVTYADVLNDSALALQGWYGINRLGVFRSGYLLDPESTHIFYGASPTIVTVPSSPSTSVHTFAEVAISELKRQPIPDMESPIWDLSMLAGDTQPSRIATGATDTMRDYLTREVWHSSSGRVPAIRLADPGALTDSVHMRGRYIQNDFDRDLWFARYFALYGGRRHFFTFKAAMTAELLALDLHDCVTLQHPRFGLSAGVKCRIVGITIDCSAKVPQMSFVLWTGSTGTYVPQPGGGTTLPPPTVNPLTQQQLLGLFTQQFFGSVQNLAVDAGGGSGVLMGDFTQTFSGSVTGDASFANVIALFHFDGADGATTAVDSSSYARSITLTSCALETTGALYGSASLSCAGSTSGQLVSYNAGSEGQLNSRDFTVEICIDAAASQDQSYPVLYAIGTSFASQSVMMFLSHAGSPSWTGKITVWVYNHSSSAPLLVGTSDLRGAGKKHVSLQRSGSTWCLHVEGVLEASATYSGSASNVTSPHYVAGQGTNTMFEGLVDEFRVTMDVARYPTAGNYTPQSTPFPNG
jgi:hypothetical protein